VLIRFIFHACRQTPGLDVERPSCQLLRQRSVCQHRAASTSWRHVGQHSKHCSAAAQLQLEHQQPAACAGSRAGTEDSTKAPGSAPGFRQHDGFPHNDYSDGFCRSVLRLGSRGHLLRKGTFGGVLACILLQPPPSHIAARTVNTSRFLSVQCVLSRRSRRLCGAHSSLVRSANAVDQHVLICQRQGT
jgi:hypothetical protein